MVFFMNLGKLADFISKYKKSLPLFVGLFSGFILFIFDKNEFPILFLLILVVIIPHTKDILEFILEKNRIRIKSEEVSKYLNFLNQFYLTFLNSNKIQRTFLSYQKQLIESSNNFDELILGSRLLEDEGKISEYLIYICFILDYNFSSREIKNQAKVILNFYLEEYQISDLDSFEKSEINLLLRFFNNYRNKKNIYLTSNFSKEEEFELFTRKYATSIYSNYMLNLDIKNSREYRRTLSKLIHEGKISFNNILDELKLENSINAFLIFSNVLEKNKPEVSNKLEQYNQIDFNGSSGEYKYKTRIIFLSKYSNPEDFIKENYSDFYKKENKIPGFVGLFPIELKNLHLFPNKDNLIIDKENYLRRNYNKLIEYKLLAESSSEENQIIFNNIPVNEILSNLPINIFIPDEKVLIKDFIIESYKKLKKKFKIKTIYDWSEINFEDLRDYFIEIDKEEIATSNKWTSISKKIIEDCKKIKESIYG